MHVHRDFRVWRPLLSAPVPTVDCRYSPPAWLAFVCSRNAQGAHQQHSTLSLGHTCLHYRLPAFPSLQFVLLTCSVSTAEACTAGAVRRPTARRPAAAQNEVFIVVVYVAGALVATATAATDYLYGYGIGEGREMGRCREGRWRCTIELCERRGARRARLKQCM